MRKYRNSMLVSKKQLLVLKLCLILSRNIVFKKKTSKPIATGQSRWLKKGVWVFLVLHTTLTFSNLNPLQLFSSITTGGHIPTEIIVTHKMLHYIQISIPRAMTSVFTFYFSAVHVKKICVWCILRNTLKRVLCNSIYRVKQLSKLVVKYPN